MLILTHAVPKAVILPDQIDQLQPHLETQGAEWFSAQAPHITQNEADAVTALKSLTSETTAQRTQANIDNSTLDETGLKFHEATHCGFMVQQMDLDPGCWSCAVRFRAPENSARTLLTLNPQDTDNYVFLQQVMGQMIFKDQQATRELTAQTGPADAPELLLAGISQGRFWLRAGNRAILCSEPADVVLDRPISLFIGCRSNKGRLKKTLGSFHLFDMVVWPNLNILEPDHQTTRAALDDPYLWRPAP